VRIKHLFGFVVAEDVLADLVEIEAVDCWFNLHFFVSMDNYWVLFGDLVGIEVYLWLCSSLLP